MTTDHQLLDSCAQLHIGTRRRVGSYFVAGVVGVIAGGIVGGALSAYGAISITAVLICVVAPQLGFIVGVKLSHIVNGHERIVYYEMLGVCLGMSAAGLAIAGEPVWPGLDLVTIGIGTFLVFGRLGCLAVGCCHGLPSRWGIRYGTDHERAGFSSHYVGIRLFPIQLLEATLTAGATAAAAILYLQPHQPGEVVAAYFTIYGLGRFALELLRGDATRPHWLGISEAQWIAVTSHWVIGALAISGAIAHASFYVAAALATSLGSIALIVVSRAFATRPLGLRHPVAVAQLFDALQAVAPPFGNDELRVETVPRTRVRVSHGRRTDDVRHFALSREGVPLDAACAETLEEQIVFLLRHEGEASVVEGKAAGVYHVMLR